jgi:hypothetical protein
MNTLSRAITPHFFTTPESYKTLQAYWSSLVRSERKHALTAAHHLLYLALRGKDWRKAFTPITNLNKLNNGAFFSWGLFNALRSLHYGRQEELLAPFEGLVTPEMLQLVRNLVPSNAGKYRAEEFVKGVFPFEAYQVPQSLFENLQDRDAINA